MPRSKPMCKFQILMNSEGYRFGTGLWIVTAREQGVFPPMCPKILKECRNFR